MFPQWNELTKGVQGMILERATRNSVETAHSLRLTSKGICEIVSWKQPLDRWVDVSKGDISKIGYVKYTTHVLWSKIIKNYPLQSITLISKSYDTKRLILHPNCKDLIESILDACLTFDISENTNILEFIVSCVGFYTQLFIDKHATYIKLLNSIDASHEPLSVLACVELGIWVPKTMLEHDAKNTLVETPVTLDQWTRILRVGNEDFITFILDLYYDCNKEHYEKLVNFKPKKRKR